MRALRRDTSCAAGLSLRSGLLEWRRGCCVRCAVWCADLLRLRGEVVVRLLQYVLSVDELVDLAELIAR